MGRGREIGINKLNITVIDYYLLFKAIIIHLFCTPGKGNLLLVWTKPLAWT